MDFEPLRVLLIGNGGREHAIAWKLSQSPLVEKIFVAPGNGGTARGLPNVENISNPKPDDFPGLVAFAKEEKINLAVPGPEAPLVAGIEGHFRSAGIRCFGPSKAAARMEGSKSFSKEFMKRHGIPTARFWNFNLYNAAKEHLDSINYKVVLKADGLAAGKGVIIPTTKEEANSALNEIMVDKRFGAAGDQVVIEEYLEGEELSFLTFSDGNTARSLPPAQDHKRIFDDDKGGNTGGMGAYGPTSIGTPELIEEVHKRVLQPTLDGMRKEGLMITCSGPRVLEYNVRFGDPETQTLLPLLESDLAKIMVACTDHYLDAFDLSISPNFSTTVIACSGGYPERYNNGETITLSNPPADTIIFHAGTTLSPTNTLLTSGGRVIASTSVAPTISQAISTAYAGIKSISFPRMHYRTDIGRRALSPSPFFSISGKTPSGQEQPLTYASAGVSIASGNSLVSLISPLLKSTARSGAPATIGGFGGTFSLHDAGFPSTSPTLIAGIDGVGTKVKLAQQLGKHDTVGIDLVAMNVNDLIVQGAEPLFFLDCYSCGKLDVSIARDFVKGVADGCRESGCALIGGETAEMPGLFSPSSASNGEDGTLYDVVGAAVGAVKAGRKILPLKPEMCEGDILLGLASSGVHSNGFSLVRKILARKGLHVTDPAPWANSHGQTVGQSLLTPTKIYVKPLLRLVDRDLVKGMAHITGGGLLENVPRMLPAHLAAELHAGAWDVPAVLRWLKKEGGVEGEEFARVWNTGLGMVVVVGKREVEEAVGMLRADGETVWEVGRLVRREGERDRCVVKGMDVWN